MQHTSPIWPAQLDHLRLESKDPRALADFYARALGFEVNGFGDDFLLQAPGRRLVVGLGAAGARTYHAYRLQDERQLADVRAYVAAKGIATEPSPAAAFADDAIAIRDPDGWLNVFGLPKPGLPAPKAANAIPARAYAARLQHVVVATPKLAPMIDFYEDVLGFVASDYVLLDEEDESTKRVAFWRTDTEHHTFAAFQASHARADHHAYETSGWMDFRDWADHLSNQNIPIAWGPGRHGPGNNLFFMIDDPNGDRIELSAEIEHLPREMAARLWPHSERTVNLWGAGWIRQ
ncbi:MAG: VOC family protein [Alphaproteobacteria bacterium]|jgi:catechol 2,3-dioxygenase-like lactoylglutathione lyase family enzyme